MLCAADQRCVSMQMQTCGREAGRVEPTHIVVQTRWRGPVGKALRVFLMAFGRTHRLAVNAFNAPPKALLERKQRRLVEPDAVVEQEISIFVESVGRPVDGNLFCRVADLVKCKNRRYELKWLLREI